MLRGIQSCVFHTFSRVGICSDTRHVANKLIILRTKHTGLSENSTEGRKPCVTVSAAGGKKGYQRELSSAEKSSKRTQSQKLGKDLVVVNLGQKGVTDSFLAGLYTALKANTMVKVRAGGFDKKETIDTLCEALDCVCIHSIGGTITLYREKGLPTPPKLQGALSVGASAADGGKSAKSKRVLQKEQQNAAIKDPPPEFKVI